MDLLKAENKASGKTILKHPVTSFTSLKFNFYKLCFSIFDLLHVCYPLLLPLSCFSLFPSA